MSEALPRAGVRPPRPLWPYVLVLAAAAVCAAWFGVLAFLERPLVVTVRFDRSHGVEEGAPVRVRGARVGEVSAVRLERGGVRLELRVDRTAGGLARDGARFWIVRPELGLEGVWGLETLVGPHYVAAVEGDGGPRRQFRGEESPWLGDLDADGGVEFVLEAPERGGVRFGSEVRFRGLLVGRIVEVRAAADGSGVEMHGRLYRWARGLLRPGTSFLRRSALRADVAGSLLGVRFGGNLLRSVVGASIDVRVPAAEGRLAPPGSRFPLVDLESAGEEPDPALPVCLDPEHAPRPDDAPRRAERMWRSKVFGRPRRLAGVVVPLAGGWIGPEDLLADAGEGEHAARLSISGESQPLPLAGGQRLVIGPGVLWWAPEGGAALASDPSAPPDSGLWFAWPAESEVPIPVDLSRLREDGSGRFGLQAQWAAGSAHGAPVVDAERQLRAVLLARDGRLWLAPIALPRRAP